ncbi:MAG: hypothetical protein IT577_13995 [Verrucomicrobiae bacterium]|nr:hypothetical protein [Verrucomicrobiae bacterium]
MSAPLHRRRRARATALALDVLFGALIIGQAGASAQGPIRWVHPPGFSKETPGLGLTQLEGVTHHVLYDPLPSKANADEGGDGRYEGVRHGTYNHHQRIVIFGDKCIVYWTNHSRDENGPGQRLLAKVGTFAPDQSDITWGGDETLVELSPAPMPVRRRGWSHDADVMREGYAAAMLQLINGRLYVRGSLVACHGWTNDVKFHGRCRKPIPATSWNDGRDTERGFRWDLWWPLGMEFVQRWKIEGGALLPDSPLYKISEAMDRIEVTPDRFKRVPPPIEPFASARPFSEAPAEMQEDVVHGRRVQFQRSPKYAPGTDKLAADGKNGLAHHTEFRRPDGRWVTVRDNLLVPEYYYAAVKESIGDDYPPAVRTDLFGQAMPVAGELPDGRPWIICNNGPRTDMYLTLSRDGVTFDRTWLLLHVDRETDGGVCKGSRGGPQYFQAVTVGPNIWVVYSIAKEQIGATRIPLRLFGQKP